MKSVTEVAADTFFASLREKVLCERRVKEARERLNAALEDDRKAGETKQDAYAELFRLYEGEL